MPAVTISRLSLNDIPGMHHEVRNSLGQLKELGWLETALYPEFKNHYKQLVDAKDLMIFVIRVGDEVAGVIEVEDRVDSYYIGYWLGVRFRRKGIMVRCVEDVIKNDLRNLKPLTARCPINNKPSAKLLEKLGFKESKRDREWIYYRK